MINLRLLNALLQRGLIIGDDDDEILQQLQRHQRRTHEPPKEFKTKVKFRGNLYRNAVKNKKRVAGESLQHFNLTTERDLGECRKIAQEYHERYHYADTFISQTLIPNKLVTRFPVTDSRLYIGKYSISGDLYVALSQQDITIFNTRDPAKPKKIKSVWGQGVNWTISDVDIDKNEENMIYSCLSPNVQIFDIREQGKRHEPLNLNSLGNQDQDDDGSGWGRGVRIMNAKFSNDGNQIVGGSFGGHVVVYHIPTRQVLNKIKGHPQDTNAVMFADRNNTNLLFTGSDDCYIKAWDKRILGQGHEHPIGVFIGHEEGVASLATRNDGIYLASNGKDQTMKLWDIRRMAPNTLHRTPLRRQPGFDYRWEQYHIQDRPKHPDDISVQTFMGHRVLRTQVRCSFSPLNTTNSRFLYTGSDDAKVYIYDIMTGEKISVLTPSGGEDFMFGERDLVRDVSWHPHKPYLSCTSFLGKISVYKFFAGGNEAVVDQKDKEQGHKQEQEQSQPVPMSTGDQDQEMVVDSVGYNELVDAFGEYDESDDVVEIESAEGWSEQPDQEEEGDQDEEDDDEQEN